MFVNDPDGERTTSRFDSDSCCLITPQQAPFFNSINRSEKFCMTVAKLGRSGSRVPSLSINGLKSGGPKSTRAHFENRNWYTLYARFSSCLCSTTHIICYDKFKFQRNPFWVSKKSLWSVRAFVDPQLYCSQPAFLSLTKWVLKRRTRLVLWSRNGIWCFMGKLTWKTPLDASRTHSTLPPHRVQGWIHYQRHGSRQNAYLRTWKCWNEWAVECWVYCTA